MFSFPRRCRFPGFRVTILFFPRLSFAEWRGKRKNSDNDYRVEWDDRRSDENAREVQMKGTRKKTIRETRRKNESMTWRRKRTESVSAPISPASTPAERRIRRGGRGSEFTGNICQRLRTKIDMTPVDNGFDSYGVYVKIYLYTCVRVRIYKPVGPSIVPADPLRVYRRNCSDVVYDTRKICARFFFRLPIERLSASGRERGKKPIGRRR